MGTDTANLNTSLSPETFGSFGALLLYLRRRARLRQRDLSIAVGYSEAQIGRLENDQRAPDLATVMAQFIPALGIENEPDLAERLVELAREARRSSDALPALAPDWPGDNRVDPGAPVAGPVRFDPELPHLLTPVLGRQPELERLATLFGAPGSRCVTLVGPGGVGKTRLAIAAAQQNATRFANGVCAVSLAGVASVELLLPSIAQALGLAAPRDGDVAASLQAHLRDKELLLLLDNLEHLVEGAGLLAGLLAAAPRLYLLATSRERLQLRGERTLEVAGLPLPEELHAGSLADNPAVALFCSSAQRVRHDSTPTANDYATAARICRLVEGLPLAIELASAWAHLLSFDEIERELQQTLDFLHTGMRDLPPRHRSLRAAFAHSWELLAPAEQRALRRLSLFRGSFSREASAAVLEESPGAALRLLGALADKSVLQRSDASGGSRFVLHELVRQYAAEYLRALPAEERAANVGHSRFFLELLHAHETPLRGPTQVSALATLAGEADHVRAAIQWAIAEADGVALRRVLPALSIWFEWSYAIYEGIALFEQIGERLRAAPVLVEAAVEHRAALALALAYAGWFTFTLTRSEAGSALLREAHALAAKGDDCLVLGDTLLFLGSVTAESGDIEGGRRLLLGCLRAYDSCGDPWRNARGLYRLGASLHQRGEYLRAQHLLATSIARLRAIGDPRALAITLNRLGSTNGLLGRYDEAQQCFQESLLYCAATHDQRSTALTLFQMGGAAQHRGDHGAARYFFHESLQIFGELHERGAIAELLAHTGYSAVVEQDYEAARAAFDSAWQIVRGSELATSALLIVIGRAALDLAEGRAERAVEALTLALYHSASGQSSRDRAAQLLRQAEGALTPYSFVAAQARGRAASVAEYL